MVEKPRVLVFGAGVLGCSIAHALCMAGKSEVALLARGAWADAIERDGLRIRHVVQRKATCDRVRVVRSLAADDRYDLIIVAMQAHQAPEVLALLASSSCDKLVFIGNDADAAGLEARIAELASHPKECAFGFFSVGGRREDGGVVAAHVKLALTVGPAAGEPSRGLTELLEGLGISLNFQDEMDGWLKWHAACILPMAYLSYAHGCDLTRATGAEIGLYLDACAELGRLFKERGIPIRPAGDDEYFYGGPKRLYVRVFYTVVFKTTLGRLCVTDHCLHAVGEMRSLADALERLLALDDKRESAPSYWTLREMMPPWDDLLVDPTVNRGV